MLKYAVALTKGNEETILGLFDTPEEARAFGREKAKEPVCGLLNMLSSDFDENGNQTSKNVRLYDCFN